MFFGAAAALESHLETIESAHRPDTKVVVLRMKRVRNPDAVGMHLLDEHMQRIEAAGVHVLLVGVRADLEDALRAHRHRRPAAPERIFHEQPVRHTSTQMGVQYAYELMDEPCETCPRRDPILRDRELGYAI